MSSIKIALLAFFSILILITVSCSMGTIESGNVGVKKTFGTIDKDEIEVGIYTAFLSSVEEYSAKEIAVNLEDLTPKAKDNLSLKDMDVTVFYRAIPNQIADTTIKYSGQAARDKDSGIYYPAYSLIHSLARNAVYDEVSKYDSLIIHTKRDDIASKIKNDLQAELDSSDRGVFQITRVVIRAVVPDPAIEESIRNVVAAQKDLEAMEYKEKIARKQAEIEIARSEGIAKANAIIQKSLTREYLQHEANEVLMKFAEKGGSNTVLFPMNMNVAPLIQVK